MTTLPSKTRKERERGMVLGVFGLINKAVSFVPNLGGTPIHPHGIPIFENTGNKSRWIPM